MTNHVKLPKYNSLGLPLKWFGMADGNSFYCSCEISQKPWLEDRAVIVASNSDKIAIALNPKAKSLGLKLGDLLFEKEKLLREHCVLVFPSNYELYGKISGDMHAALASFVQDYEVSSIDEGFLDFTGFDDYVDLYRYGREIIDTIRYGKWIPISLGIAQTKTLAKAANKLAKKSVKVTKGLYIIATEQERIEALKKLPLEDVWGLGRRLCQRIADELGVREGLTAWDFAGMYRKRVRKLFGVTVERTWMELQGIQCYDFEYEPEDKESIMTSRMLTPPLTGREEVLSALMRHLAVCARKLRRQDSYARKMFVFFMTSQHKDYKGPRLVRSRETRFPSPINTTVGMIPYLTAMVESMWPVYRPGQTEYRFNKCGVMLGEITPDSERQSHIGEDIGRSRKTEALQKVVDRINGDAPADKRTALFGSEFAHRDRIAFKREGLTENPAALWEQRHRIQNS